MKILGIGAMIAPVGASGLIEPAVTLVEPTKVITPDTEVRQDAGSFLYEALAARRLLTMQVMFKDERGRIAVMECTSFLSHLSSPVHVYERFGHVEIKGSIVKEWEAKVIV